jgi:hypothetical protein
MAEYLPPGVAFAWALSYADGVIFCERVSGIGGDDVTDPTERSASADPHAGRDDQPQNPGQYAAIVKLAHAGNEKTKNACGKWIAHRC